MNMQRYRVMSFDGGPGAMTFLLCLCDLQEANPGMIEATDLFVGSSAGSWTALYLARNMARVERGEWTGLELLQNCHAAVEAMMQALTQQDAQSWVNFLLGRGPLGSLDGVQALMQQEDYLGTTRFGDLPAGRRVVISAARMAAPWGPRAYDSADPADDGVLLSEAGLCSAAFPLLLPVRDNQVDGAMYTNNPAMVGLVRAIGGAGRAAPVPRERISLLTLGSDDGSSHLSNVFMPGEAQSAQAEEPTAPPESLSAFFAEAEARGRLLEHLGTLDGRVRDLLPRLHHEGRPLLAPEHAESIQGAITQLKTAVADTVGTLQRRTRPAAPAAGGSELEWGWPPWLLYPLNLFYVLQVWLNSEGRGAAEQARCLLGERAFRLAPVGLLGTQIGFMLLMFNVDGVVFDFAQLTAAQWRQQDPWLRALYGFSPGLPEADRWVKGAWLD